MAHKDDYNLSELVDIEVRGLKYSVMPRYLYHYQDQDYETFSLDLLDRLVTPGSTMIDVGAHYGIYSLLAAQKAAQVYAFEPVPENHSILQRNVLNNELTNVETINKAVSDEVGQVSFNVPWASDSAGFYEHPNAETIRKITVDMTTIDEQLKTVDNISLVKIDTEGHELHVLNGMRKTLSRNPNAKLLIEFNPACLEAAASQPEDLVNALIDLGYDIFAVHEQSRRFVAVDASSSLQRILKGQTYINFLCVPAGQALSVLFVSHSASNGGAELLLQEVVSALTAETKRFVIPAVVLPAQGPLTEAIRQLAIPTEVIGYKEWVEGQKISPAEQAGVDAYNAEGLLELQQLIDDLQPQVVVTNTMLIPWGALAARALRVPHVWWINEFGDADHGFSFNVGYRQSLQFINDYSDVVITNSKAVQKHIQPQISATKSKVLYQCVTVPEPKVINPVFKTKAALKLIIAGRVMPSKGQLDAIMATEKLAAEGTLVELNILGSLEDKQYHKQLKRYVADNKLESQVHFLGYKPNPQDYIAQADVLLMCSANEAFGRVTVEAMLLAKPVIGTNSGGTPEIIEDGATGSLYKAGDVDSLVTEIKQFMTHRDKLQHYGAAGLARAQKIFQGPFYEQVLKLLIATKQTELEPLPLVNDILNGMEFLLQKARAQTTELFNTKQAELHDFSVKYNEVYAAYHQLEKQLAETAAPKSKNLQAKAKDHASRVIRKIRKQRDKS